MQTGDLVAPADAAAWCESKGEAVGWSGGNWIWRTGSSSPSGDRRTRAWPRNLDLNLLQKDTKCQQQIKKEMQQIYTFTILLVMVIKKKKNLTGRTGQEYVNICSCFLFKHLSLRVYTSLNAKHQQLSSVTELWELYPRITPHLNHHKKSFLSTIASQNIQGKSKYFDTAEKSCGLIKKNKMKQQMGFWGTLSAK